MVLCCSGGIELGGILRSICKDASPCGRSPDNSRCGCAMVATLGVGSIGALDAAKAGSTAWCEFGVVNVLSVVKSLIVVNALLLNAVNSLQSMQGGSGAVSQEC